VSPHELHINDPAFYENLYNLSPDIDRNSTTLGKSALLVQIPSINTTRYS
jgi:hypothetical protein